MYINQIVRLNQLYEKDKSIQNITTIKIDYNPETKNITVYNDGNGISVDLHNKENIYSSINFWRTTYIIKL